MSSRGIMGTLLQFSAPKQFEEATQGQNDNTTRQKGDANGQKGNRAGQKDDSTGQKR